MAKDTKGTCCETPTGEGSSCCNVEAVVSVDERGQMVLPKDIREKAGIKAGDKLAIIAMRQEGKICCLAMIKVEALADMVKGMLGPVMKEIF
ncbi:MAG: HgcAB-associated protein [Chloroflexi bacterium]|nr:HgcAB-associated protein [Chloroflexota bacterium]